MDLLGMSDLQISLIIIGIVIIIGVAIFNWIQQTRYRRKIESTMDHQPDDVLFETKQAQQSENSYERIEPSLGKDFFFKKHI